MRFARTLLESLATEIVASKELFERPPGGLYGWRRATSHRPRPDLTAFGVILGSAGGGAVQGEVAILGIAEKRIGTNVSVDSILIGDAVLPITPNIPEQVAANHSRVNSSTANGTAAAGECDECVVERTSAAACQTDASAIDSVPRPVAVECALHECGIAPSYAESAAGAQGFVVDEGAARDCGIREWAIHEHSCAHVSAVIFEDAMQDPRRAVFQVDSTSICVIRVSYRDALKHGT